MSFIDFINQIPNYVVFSLSLILFVAIHGLLKNRKINIKTDKFYLTSYDEALMFEKIMEIAYEAVYVQTTKKLKAQMSNFEKIALDVTYDLLKEFRVRLLKKLDLNQDEIFNLDLHEDFQAFENALYVVRLEWKGYAREFFRNSFIEKGDWEHLKDSYLTELNKIRDSVLNKYYRDKFEGCHRNISRNEIHLLIKEKQTEINVLFLDTFNFALIINEESETEKQKKIGELKKLFNERNN